MPTYTFTAAGICTFRLDLEADSPEEAWRLAKLAPERDWELDRDSAELLNLLGEFVSADGGDYEGNDLSATDHTVDTIREPQEKP